jgi:hypothetical protein
VSPVPELLHPTGLIWLSLVPLLLVPYLLRQRPRRRIVAALFLFNGIEPAQRLRLGGRLRLRPLFLLQLLLLIVAIAALCRPALRSSDVRSALVLDNSASLSAIDASGETRFVAAVRAADHEVARDPAGNWDLFLLSPMPHELGQGLSPGQASPPRAAPTPTIRFWSRSSTASRVKATPGSTSSPTAPPPRAPPSSSSASGHPRRIVRSRISASFPRQSPINPLR